MESQQYLEYIRPDWAPPSWLFGPVWSVLYTIIFITFGYIFYKTFKGEISKKVALPFSLNIFFNLIFTPIQFGLQNNLLATLDIFLVVGTLIWAFITLWKSYPKLRWVVHMNIPYLLWGTFATILQVTITYLNW